MTSHPTNLTSAQTQTMDLSDETPDQDGQTGSSGARKRKRAHYSCVECSKRKAKCDRSLPCAGCVSRRIPGLCKYLVAGYEDPLKQTEEIKSRLDRNIEISEDVRERLGRLEGLLVQQQQQQQQLRRPQPQATHFPPTHFPPEQNLCLAGPSRQQPQPHHLRQQHEIPDLRRVPLRREDLEEVPGLKGRITEGSFFGTSAMATVEQPGLLDHGDQGNASGSMGSDPRWREIVHEIPERADVELLLDHYFAAINLTRCPVREIPFMVSQQELLVKGENLEPPDQVFLPLLFIVLAISRLNCSHPKLDNVDARLHPDNLYSASRRSSALVDGLAKAPISLDRVMADFLTARYLILVRRASDAYVTLGAAISRAQSQGLHRDSKGLDFVVDLVQEEDRRRAWQYVYHLDRYLGLLVGRPHQIQDEDCDVDPPSTDVTQPHVSWGFTCGLDDVESTLRFILLRTSMAKIMARLSKEAFGIRPAGFEKTLELDRVLVDWAEALPRDFQILSTGRAEGSDTRDLHGQVDLHTTHRFLLSAEYNYARITLHRPFLLLSVRQSGDNTGQRYKESLEACYQSAMDDLWARSIHAQHGMGKLSGGTYRITTCAVILGVIMLVDPAKERLRTIRDCLQAFTRARREGNWLDEVGIQGFALLELIQARAESGVIGTPEGLGAGGIGAGQAQTQNPEWDRLHFDAAPPSSEGLYTKQGGASAGLTSNQPMVNDSNVPWPIPQTFDSQSQADVNPSVFPWAGDFSSSDYELFEALMAHFNST